MLRFVSILFVGLFLFAHGVSGQVCRVEGYPDNIVRLSPQNETLPGNVMIANLQLVDVDTTTTVAHPHNTYVQALRYPNGAYELMTTATFKDFITAERTGEITRQANLYCTDGTTVVRVTFIIPVADMNDKAPTFDKAEYNGSVEIPANPTDETTLLETKMIVSDADYEPQNAQVEFTSDHPAFTPTATPMWNGSYPVVYEYEVNILVNNTVSSGVYLVNVTGSDGVNEGSATVEITVSHDAPPTTTSQPATTTTQQTTQPSVSTDPEEPETTTESGEEPIMGVVDFERCGGFGTFHELRVQGSEGAAANMTTGTPYQITGTYSTISSSNFVRLGLSTMFEGDEMTLLELDIPDSGYTPGQNVTARFQVTLPATLSGEELRFELNLSNHNSILEACISFAANIL